MLACDFVSVLNFGSVKNGVFHHYDEVKETEVFVKKTEQTSIVLGYCYHGEVKRAFMHIEAQ